MKNECDIVKDLLFSYNDNILSNTSKEFVENHLKECDECQRFLKEIREDCTKKNSKKEIDFLKKFRHKIARKNALIAMISICLICFIIFNIQAYIKYKEVSSTMQIYDGKVFEAGEVKIWKCRNCGHIVVGTKAPEVCPVCSHPKAYFEIKAENY